MNLSESLRYSNRVATPGTEVFKNKTAKLSNLSGVGDLTLKEMERSEAVRSYIWGDGKVTKENMAEMGFGVDQQQMTPVQAERAKENQVKVEMDKTSLWSLLVELMKKFATSPKDAQVAQTA